MEIVESFPYDRYTVNIVRGLFGLSCAQTDGQESIYVDEEFWKLLTPEEKEAVLKHESKELDLIRKGYFPPIAHILVVREETPETRRTLRRKCGKAHREKRKKRLEF